MLQKHVEELQFASELSQTKQKQCIKKRSFRRALKRAETHGFTLYRGRLYTAQQLGTEYKGFSHDAPKTQNVTQNKRLRRQRFTCFSWNCSGLSPSGWDYLQQWIDSQRLDILMLQETHWRYTSDWSLDHYFALHSGAADGRGGLLCLISKALCDAAHLSWQEIVPGRLMHFRIHGRTRDLDFINIYQHIHAKDRMEDRHSLWHALQSLLTSFPQRNHLTILGDWNTSLQHTSTAVGLGTYRWQQDRCGGPKHSDANLLHNILQQFDLIATNTWDHSLGPTYIFGKQTSRIDFAVCRRCHSDETSRQVQYLIDFPLNCVSGAHHIPQIYSMLKVWHSTYSEAALGWTRTQRLELYHQWTQNPEASEKLQHDIKTTINSLPLDGNRFENVHTALNEFPAPKLHRKREAVHLYDTTPFQLFQEHSRRLRALLHPTLDNLFQAWFHVHRRCKARQQMRVTSAKARKLRLQKIFNIAGRAAAAKDHFRLYQAIRELAPKQPFRRIQIRDHVGNLLNPSDAADRIRDWLAMLYHDPEADSVCRAFDWPFTAHELQQGLCSLPALKALSPGYAPAPFWHCAAEEISDYLQDYFRVCSAQSCLPRQWNTGSLCLLPKHARRTHVPQDLRPITLLEPCSKALLGTLAHHLFEIIGEVLCSVPQYAYLPGRGTEDALARVLRHCDVVRASCKAQQYPIHHSAQGLQSVQLGGGLIVTMDLSKAFDMVPRSRLFRCLSSLGVPNFLLDFLHAIYFETSYTFQHRGQTRSLDTSRGIRQGCKAAPTLWAAYATGLLLNICQHIDEQWLYDCITMYADDGCLHEAVTSPEQFRRLITRIGTTLDLIEDAQLVVNFEKTYALLRLVGTAVPKIQKQYILRNSKGTFLKIPRRDGQTTHIRLVKHFQYLGATVCYHNYERATTLARIKASEKTGQQLHRWLHTTRGLNGYQKYLLWQQCVFTTLRYSLNVVGYTTQSVKMIDSACLLQLRRIFRCPVHLTHLTHQDFLTQHNLTDPLLQLVAFCQDAQVRDHNRRYNLKSSDILLRDPPTNFDLRMQVLTTTWYLLRHRHLGPDTAVPDSQMVCPECCLPFASLMLLRKHLTEVHGDRPGAIRMATPADRAGGVPTCSRCLMQFTTYHSLTYHVQFVCMAPQQDIEEVEHRVRVQELLQYARGQQLQALVADASLLAYFHHRCALCSYFSVTVKGLLTHWQREHLNEFQRHEPVNDMLLSMFEHDSPCQLCGTSFKRYHKCHIIRQMALLLTLDGHTAAQAQSSLVCQHCGKVYTTRHGLLQHERRFHRAEQAVETVSAKEIDLQCQIHQAVVANRCEDLLLQEDIQHFLSLRCIKCQKQYAGKRELSRHIKQNHSSEWHECLYRAMELDQQWKPQFGCVCKPVMYTKHTCQLYLQFALLRLDHERQLMPQLIAEPPDQILSVVEQIEPLLWLGYVHNLYSKSALKMNLTMHCQVCGYSGANAEDLRNHLHALHPVHLQESLYLKELFQWTMFMEMGCFCNPAPGWGTLHHECVGLLQLAIIAASFNWQVIIPWPFTTQELTALLADVLPCAAFQRISMALMTRNFHLLWDDSELLGLLATRCLICQEAVELSHIQAHMVVQHQITADKLKYLTHQLSAVFAHRSLAEERCDWCNELFPTYLDPEDILQVDPHAHLQRCPMISQLALLLMHPRWSKPALQTLTWASQEQIAETRRLHELKNWQFNVSTSDTFGLSMELTAQCGLQLLEDDMIAGMVNHKCLLCGKAFFFPQHMIKHLHLDHNFLQYQTHMCYHRLLLRCQDPCQFCGFKQHSAQCPTLLNLAVFLLNGYGIRGRGRHRCGVQDLGKLVDESSDGPIGHLTTVQPRQQETSDRSEGPQNPIGIHLDHISPDGCIEQSLQTGPETRGHHQQSPPGESVPVTFRPRRREHSPPDVGHQPQMAPTDGENGSAQTPPGGHHGDGTGAAASDLDEGHADGGAVSGLQELPLGERRQRQDDAVPPLEPSTALPRADGADQFADCRGHQEPSEHFEVACRPSGHTTLPQFEESDGRPITPASGSMALDGGTSQQPRVVASGGSFGLSQFLAAHPGTTSSTRDGALTARQANSEDPVTCIPIFINSTGTACFANVVVISLAWMALLANGDDPSQWVHGFELLRNIFSANHRLMDLPNFGPFVWLLLGAWSVESFRFQHDVCEFAIYLLHVMQPQFLHCSWVTRPERLAPGDNILPSEKGSRFTPVQLAYADHTSDACQLQHLIDLWTDQQGLCRAFEEAGHQMILTLDRYDPETQTKCQQKIEVSQNRVGIPCFAPSPGDVHFDSFDICAIVYHLGASPLSGHYRTALRYQRQWMIYEDGRPPDRMQSLPELVQRNSVMYWLIRPTPATIRTMETEDPRLFRSFSTLTRDADASDANGRT